MNLSNQDVQLGQEMFTASATAQHPLGTRGSDPFGRIWRYALAGIVDLVAGNALQSSAIVTTSLARVVNTTSQVSVGSRAITITIGASVAANFYKDGFLAIATGSGAGLVYAINNHAAITSAGTGIINLYDEDALKVAITTTSTVSLVANKYAGVVAAPITTATGVNVGVASYIIPAGQFGWIQTWGPCAVLADDTTAVGASVNSVAATIGRASGFTAASLLTGQSLGQLMQAGVQGQWVFIDLRISP